MAEITKDDCQYSKEIREKYDRIYKPFEDTKNDLAELILSIPGSKIMLSTRPSSGRYIYGGILRFIYQHYFEFGSLPSRLQVMKYLVNGDIDIKYRSRGLIPDLVKAIQDAGGIIEYVGADYSVGTDYLFTSQSICENGTVITKFGVDNFYYQGLYTVWFPVNEPGVPELKYVRYDIMTSGYAAVGYEDDYTVNQINLFVSQKDNEMIWSFRVDERVENHLTDKKIVPIHTVWYPTGYKLLKRVYRIKKLMAQGYFPTKQVCGKLLALCEKELITGRKKDHLLIINEQPIPTCVPEAGIVHFHKHTPVDMTLDEWRRRMKPVYDHYGDELPKLEPEDLPDPKKYEDQ